MFRLKLKLLNIPFDDIRRFSRNFCIFVAVDDFESATTVFVVVAAAIVVVVVVVIVAEDGEGFNWFID